MKEEKKEKPVSKLQRSKVSEKKTEETKEVTVETVEERDLLKEAEEREKARKVEERVAKAEAKKEEREKHAGEIKEKKAAKVQVRVKPRHGKKYRELAKLIEKDKEYPIHDSIDLALKTSPAKFDATVELHVAINKKEKNIRGMVMLPGGLVKEKKIKEVTEKNADEVVADIKAGKIDFDILLADLKVMPRLAPLAKILGPKGLMPSPKAGTAVENVEKAAEELKSGKVEYRVDKNNVVHMAIGKISFGEERIKQNYDALIGVLPFKRIDSIYLTTTMGPSVKVARK